MIPYGRQTIDQEDVGVVLETLTSDYLTQGPKVEAFEKTLADYCGVKYALVTTSGTAALHLSYLALGLREGDEVIVTPNTFVATINMLLVVGAKPVFCDIRLDTYNIDEEKIEECITENTKAIVAVHFAGQSCNMEKIHSIAKKYNLSVIEDACHALGAKYNNKRVGSLSDMATFSFRPVKPITTGEGGAIVTNSKVYYEKMKLLRSHGIYKDENGRNIMTDLGYNYRMTDIQAALGISQLKKLDSFIEKRREIVSWYKEYLQDVEEIILPIELDENYSGWHLYVIRTRRLEDRDGLVKFLKDNEVGVNFHYPAVYSHPYYRECGHKDLELVNEEEYEKSCVTLPCFPGLEKESTKSVSYLIHTYF